MANIDDGPLVSIVILHHGFAGVTKDCLSQVLKQSHTNLEVFVVENGEAEVLPASLMGDPRCRLIRSATNLGYSGGNNLALQQASGEWIALINNDVILPDNWVALMLASWPSEAWGLMSSVIVKYGSHSRIQYAGFTAVSRLSGRNRIIGAGDTWHAENKVTETAYAHGSAMMVSARALQAAGMLPEQYFLHYEELDWSEQIRRAGFKIGVIHGTSAPHYGSLTLGKDSPRRWYYYHRGRLTFQRRWLSPWQKALFFLYYFLLATPKEILTHLMSGKWAHLRAWAEAVGWHLSHLGALPARAEGRRAKKKGGCPSGTASTAMKTP